MPAQMTRGGSGYWVRTGMAIVWVVLAGGPLAAAGPWTVEQKLSPADLDGSEYMGMTVRVVGDGGGVYIFERAVGTWTETAKLVPNDLAAGDRFGYFVDIVGDTLVASALNKHGVGAAYVFERSGGVWTQSAKLTASDAAADDWFGAKVALEGDIAVVAGYLDDDGASDAGSAYVFERTGSTWTQVAKLTASDPQADHRFSGALGISGDTIVVGAPGDANWTGAVYVFDRPAAGWTDMTETAKLVAGDLTAGDVLGCSVDIDAGVVVAAARAQAGGRGAVYVFAEPAGGWADATGETAKLTVSDGAASDLFGRDVAVSGDAILVGADRVDAGATDTGAAYVYVKPATGWATATEDARLVASDRAGEDEFGIAVALNGDVAVVGAHRCEGAAAIESAGAAYVFVKPAAGWKNATETAELTASDPSAYAGMGIDVAVDGETVVAGAYQDDPKGLESGSAYLFEMPATGWAAAAEDAKLVAADGAPYDRFGFQVAVDDGTVIATARGHDALGADAGAAYVFVPEPASLALLGVGAAGLWRGRRR